MVPTGKYLPSWKQAGHADGVTLGVGVALGEGVGVIPFVVDVVAVVKDGVGIAVVELCKGGVLDADVQLALVVVEGVGGTITVVEDSAGTTDVVGKIVTAVELLIICE